MTQIGILQIELHLPAAQSLKEKRHVLKSLKDRLQAQFNLSVAEVGFLDKWQRAELAIVMVSADKNYLESQFNHIKRFIDQEIMGSAHVTHLDLQFI